jgi:UDP-glucuronate decarboxylase
VVSNFIVQALTGQPITIYGDGSHTRSFCYVDDLVEGFVRLMRTSEQFIGPVNLGNPAEFTMRELAGLVLELTGSRSRIAFKPLPTDDPKRRCPDISLAGAQFDWTPTVSPADGLKKTIAHFESTLSRKPSTMLLTEEAAA